MQRCLDREGPPPSDRPAESDGGDSPAANPAAGATPPGPVPVNPPTGHPATGGLVSERPAAASDPKVAQGDVIARRGGVARAPSVAARWLSGLAGSPIDGFHAAAGAGSGWLVAGVLMSSAHNPTSSLGAGAPMPAARARAAPAKTNVERQDPPSVPAPADPAEPAVGASAAAAASAAPPALSCAIFAALAALAAYELRRLRARLLVPDAPGVASRRDRPG